MLYLILLSIVFASLNSVILHKADLSGSTAVYKFNMIGAAVWCVCLFAVNGFKLHIDKTVLLWGVIYGITQALFILFKTLAMNSGAVSVTTLIGNTSLLVSVLFCFLVWQEPINAADIIGLAILMLGIACSTYEKKNENISRKWVVYSMFFLLFAAGVGISFKAFGKTGNVNSAGDMMLIASVVMLASYTVICLCVKKRNASRQGFKIQKEFIIYALLSGCLSCVYNRMNIYLASVVDAVVFFPSFNGGVVFLSAFLSVLLLKEKLKLKTAIGIVLGIAGICIIGIL